MKKVLILRYGEIFLKGKNRGLFAKALVKNIKNALADFDFSFERTQGRYVISNFDEAKEDQIVSVVTKVAGLHSLSVAFEIPSTKENIREVALSLIEGKIGKFKVSTNRADKTFPIQSMEFSAWLGGEILDSNSKLSVDLHSPDFVVSVDIRENGNSFVFLNSIPCLGGMPVGTSGNGLLLLSGGIDSPVAGFRMVRRGMKMSAVHFESFPYTSKQAEDKAIQLAGIVAKYNGPFDLFVVSVSKIQDAIFEFCDHDYTITLLRRFMMRISQKLCEKFGLQAIVTGESLGQVASQTIESMAVIEKVTDIPFLRPLVSMDKEETIEIARKIGSFDISVKPFDDCCTVFLPENPVIKPKLSYVLKQESKLKIDELVDDALSSIRIVQIN